MILTCSECEKQFTKPTGWGLEVCVDCFDKSLSDFIDAMKDEPRVENITVYKGDKKVVVKEITYEEP